MKSTKSAFTVAVLALLLALPLAVFATNEPVNSCIVIPEIMTGRGDSGPQDTGNGYQPESCITLDLDALNPLG